MMIIIIIIIIIIITIILTIITITIVITILITKTTTRTTITLIRKIIITYLFGKNPLLKSYILVCCSLFYVLRSKLISVFRSR
jgi:hypothetical protein